MQIFVVALIARALGVSDFGVFVATSSVVLVLMTFSELGMGARLLTGLSTVPSRRNLTTFTIVRVLLLVAVSVGSVFVAASLHLDAGLIVAASIYAAGDATGDLATAILQGAKRSGYAMLLLCGRRLLVLGLLWCIPGEEGAVIAITVGGAAGALVFGVLACRNLARPRRLRELIAENLRIILSGGASSAAQLDVAMVSAGAGSVAAGLYGSASRLFNPINLVVSTMVQVFVPEVAGQAGQPSRLRAFRRVRIVVLLFAVAVAAASVMGPWIVVVLYGPQYQGAAPIAVAVFLAAAFSAIGQAYMAWYYATEIPKLVPVLMWAASIIGIAAILLLASLFGVVGAAGGLVLMHLLALGAIVIPWKRSLEADDG
ncbi:oligosaccharide flippase family protein [Microbacterium sp. CnD16-F]|nr:oligosaccharide flippase family protein [Microbacterium sp. CnD16-F]